MDSRTYDDLIGRNAYDRDGERLGEVKDIYYDDVTGRPEWVEVGGVFSDNRLAPINGAVVRDDDDLTLAVTETQAATAPSFDLDQHLAPEQEQTLYTHYGFQWDTTDESYGYGTYDRTSRFDRDYALPAPTPLTTETTSDVVEEVDVATERPRVETETTTRKARLRKYTVHGTETVEVPVSHEEVRLEVEGEETRDA